MSGTSSPDGLPRAERRAVDAATLSTVAWTAIIVATVFLPTIGAVQRAVLGRVVVALAGVFALGAIALWCARRGAVRVGGWILVVGLIVLVTVLAIRAGGVRSPGVGAYVVFVLMGGFLLGERAGIALGILCGLLGLGLLFAERAGALPPASVEYTATSRWLLSCIFIGITIAVQRLAFRSMRRALQRADAELVERREAQRDRERLLNAVQERVKELSLLHAAARLLQRDRHTDAAFLRELVTRIPEAWQHRDVCVARIAYRDLEASTPGWRETPWMMTAELRSSGGSGRIDVAYLEPRGANGSPFLAEEREVLDSLAELLEAHLDREHADTLRRSVEGQLRQSQKMEALGTLAGGIAHDFNNILTAITGNARLAQEIAAARTPVREHLDEIARAADRAVDLVRRILAFSRKQEARKRPLRLEAIVEEVAKLLRTSAPPSVTIAVEPATGIPSVLADSSQLHQVLMNLGTNAIHAMRDRGGTLAFRIDVVERDPATVPPALALVERRSLRVRVTDTGSGMSPEVLDRIFEPFFSTKGHAGTGLGMSVVHGIVQEHDGAITIESTVGTGTTITVYLPAIAGDLLEPEPAAALPRGTGQRVLYVDDEEAVLFVMTRMLRRLGYQVTGFTDPHAALQAFRTEPAAFDCAVTDYAMPGMSGHELGRALRAVRPDLPIARSSGHRHDDPDAEAERIMLLHKPATLEEVAAAMHRMTSR